VIRRAAWRGAAVVGRLDVAVLVLVLVPILVFVAEIFATAALAVIVIAVAVTTSRITTILAIAVVREIGVVRAKFPRDRTAAAQGPASLVPEPATYLRAVVEGAAAADEGLALALPDGGATLVAVLPEAIAADLRVRLVSLAFFVHAPEASRHGVVVQGCPQGGEGGEH
jgi:hypothetical protein